MMLRAYRDPVGKLTIGVGRNIEDLGITEAEAFFLLAGDIRRVEGELDANTPWWRALPEAAQRGLANMCFNLGWPRLSGFQKMLAALEAGEFNRAAAEALHSRWARQVGARARRIADLYVSAGTQNDGGNND
ncbi:MAG: lysozyme [Rhodospirillaceae bacterium]